MSIKLLCIALMMVGNVISRDRNEMARYLGYDVRSNLMRCNEVCNRKHDREVELSKLQRCKGECYEIHDKAIEKYELRHFTR